MQHEHEHEHEHEQWNTSTFKRTERRTYWNRQTRNSCETGTETEENKRRSERIEQQPVRTMSTQASLTDERQESMQKTEKVANEREPLEERIQIAEQCQDTAVSVLHQGQHADGACQGSPDEKESTEGDSQVIGNEVKAMVQKIVGNVTLTADLESRNINNSSEQIKRADGEKAATTTSGNDEDPSGRRRPLELGDWYVDFEKRIGRGSYAVVWKAIRSRKKDEVCLDQNDNSIAAVKEVMLSQLSDKLVESLESEVNILKKVKHMNIVSLYDIHKHPGKLYLVLEYCSGGDLSTFLRRNGRLSEDIVRRFMSQLSSGLGAMRQLSLVHRDLKPQNLLLTSCNGNDAVLKIGDFGFARYIQPHGMAETLCGSPLYMAPEILMMNKYDAKADLWSVGAIMFEMLAGRPPFTGNNHVELLKKIEKSGSQGGGGQLPPKVAYSCSNKCKALLRGLLQRRPVSRISHEELFAHPFLESVNVTVGSLVSISPTRKLKNNSSKWRNYSGETNRKFYNTSCDDSGKADSSKASPETTPRQDLESSSAPPGTSFQKESISLNIVSEEEMKRAKSTVDSKEFKKQESGEENFSGGVVASTDSLGDYVVVDEHFDELVGGDDVVSPPASSVLGFPAALSSPEEVKQADDSMRSLSESLNSGKDDSQHEIKASHGMVSANNGEFDSITPRITSLEAAGEALSEAVIPTSTGNFASSAHVELSLSLFAAEIINAAMELAQHLPHGNGEPRRRRLRADLEAALNRARRAGRSLAASSEVMNASILPNQVAVAFDAAVGFIRQGAVEELVGSGGDMNKAGSTIKNVNLATANASYARAAAILRVLRDEAPYLPLAPPFRPNDHDKHLLSKHIQLCSQNS